MKYELKTNNVNYNATVVTIDKTVDLAGCDNVKAAIIFGNSVIISKDTAVGTKGIFFPVETQLNAELISANNLYRNSTLNVNKEKKGYFEESRRVKCMKFRGHRSEGLFLPIDCLDYISKVLSDKLRVNESFNEIVVDGKTHSICQKYVIVKNTQNSVGGSGKGKHAQKKLKKFSKLVEDQFRFHTDTVQLKRNIHMLNKNDVVSITAKLHGTSFVASNIITKKMIPLKDKIAKFFGVNVIDTEYSVLYSSRTVLRNSSIVLNDPSAKFKTEENTKTDIYKDIAENKLKNMIPKGFTFYGEAVGYMPGCDSMIQKDYAYGCSNGTYEIYIYKMTFTNADGKVYLIPWMQMKEYCDSFGIKTPELFYYGKISEMDERLKNVSDDEFCSTFVDVLFSKSEWGMNDVMCKLNDMKVPSEGTVVRKETSLNFNSFTAKAKNFLFLKKETEDLDKGVVDMESAETTEQPTEV